MALITKTLTQFVTHMENEEFKLIALSFKPVSAGNPTRFIAVVLNTDAAVTNRNEVWEVTA